MVWAVKLCQLISRKLFKLVKVYIHKELNHPSQKLRKQLAQYLYLFVAMIFKPKNTRAKVVHKNVCQGYHKIRKSKSEISPQPLHDIKGVLCDLESFFFKEKFVFQ